VHRRGAAEPDQPRRGRRRIRRGHRVRYHRLARQNPRRQRQDRTRPHRRRTARRQGHPDARHEAAARPVGLPREGVDHVKANAAQESEGWLLERAGKFTASRADKLMSKLRDGKPAASRAELLTILAIERLTGEPVETYQNEAMRRGAELEAEARDA